MLETPKIRKMYADIQTKIFYMIPEKWEKIYLYASVIENINYIETGEMFFYYFPKGILKKNPVNVYEVPARFNIDEQAYLELAEQLYDQIKELREEFRKIGQRVWSNVTISIEDLKFKIEYHYENLMISNYSSYDRHLIWKYKYLNDPLEKLNQKDREMVKQYLINEKFVNEDTYQYCENILKNKIYNIIEYNNDNREEIETNYEEKELNRILQKLTTQGNKPKNKYKSIIEQSEAITTRNQILNL